MVLYAWKFLIRKGEWLGDESRQWSGCVAVSLAATQDEAKANLERYAAENGFDARWLAHARVLQIPLVAGANLSWAEV